MDPRAREELARIEEEIKACTRCPLHKTRTKPVPGEGGYRLPILFVGEAPGRNEDIQGRPFVGRAGELLNELLGMIGLTREDVYITNVLKCRPPSNRDPKPEEIAACAPFLERQIRVLDPRVIVTLGRFSWMWMCEHMGIEYQPLSRVHGRSFSASTLFFGQKTVFPTFHPAAALYRPPIKDVLVEDFKKLGELLERIGLLDRHHPRGQ